MTEEKQFKEADNFDDWFELNEDLIHEMHRNDAYELLWETWFAGYSNGLDRMAHVASPLWPKSLANDTQVDKTDDSV